jgi:hypothetical protein
MIAIFFLMFFTFSTAFFSALLRNQSKKQFISIMASNTPTEESFDSKSNLGFFNNFLKLFQKEKQSQSQGTFAVLFF